MRQSTRFRKVVSVGVFLLFPFLLAAQSAGKFKEDAVPVVCPAIDQDELPRTDYPYDSSMPISLVAMGDARRASETNSDRVFELTIERVLYGSFQGKTVRFSNPWNLQQTQHVIVALAPRMYDAPAPFELRYELPGDELKTQLALARARLDYRVSSAECIFVGKDTSVHGDFYHTVEVVRSIYGSSFKAGQKVTVQIADFIPMNDRTPQVSSNQMIYLVRPIEKSRRLYGLPAEMASKEVYTMLTRFNVDEEDNVREALTRRDSRPVIEANETGKQIRHREIVLDGDAADAIALLGSASDAAVTLGVRKLKTTPDSLHAVVVAAEQDLFDFKIRENNGYRRLHNLIRLLEDMDQGTSKGEIGKLLDKFLSRIEAAPPPLGAAPERRRFSHYWSDEEEAEDVNHSLAWLMMVLKTDDVTEHFAQKAIDLRNKLSDPWKAEVQLALDAASVEDNLEVQAAKKAVGKSEPLRIAPAIMAGGQAVGFSHDGRFLACGTNVWNTENWSKAGVFEQEGSIEQVVFSKDDKLLYVIGGGAVAIHKRFDWKSGRLDREFQGHKSELSYIALTPDGGQMLTASATEGVIHLWDAKSGRILKSFQLPDQCHCVALSPNGLLLARQTAPHEITIESQTGVPAIKLNLPERDEVCAVAFSPDGIQFFVATFGFASKLSMNQVVHLLSYDVATGFKPAANTTQPANRCTSLAVSPDSKQLVFGDQEGRVWAASLPDLKVVRPILMKKEMGISSGGIAFSPDGKVLVVGSFDDAIHVFDAHTFEPIQQPSGHRGRVRSIYFSNDGTTLRSLGTDETVCLWDVATGQMKDRFSLPKGTTCVSIRAPDGHYALCASALDVESPFWDQKKNIPPVKVVDLNTGKIICDVDLPVNWSFTATRNLWLREPEALCLADGTARRFNYLTGKLNEKRNVDIEKENLLYNGVAYVADDGKTLYEIDGGHKAGRVTLKKCDADTGQSTTIGDADLPHVTGNDRGLVPGGKYFFIGDPGIYIYDLNAVHLAAQKRMKGFDLLCVSFSPQGDYYAVAAGARREVRSDFTIYEPAVQTEVRVQDTLTSKTVFAFPAHSRWVKDIRFSPDAKKLAVVTDDGFIEIWKLNTSP